MLKSFQKLKNPRKSLSNQDFLKFLESRPDEKFFELRAYSVMIISHLHLENREHYFELIEKLLNSLIKFLELRKEHRSINDAVERLEAELILLKPNEKSEGFDHLIEELVSLFDRYCSDPCLRESHKFSKEELKKLIQKIFIEMKDRYP